MTTTPYSEHWRTHTRERLERHGLTPRSVAERLELSVVKVAQAFAHDAPVCLEVAGPIDEYLARLDARAEARVLEHGTLVPVACDLNALCDCSVSFYGERPR